MNVRSLVSIATLSLASMALLVGCPEEQKPGGAPSGGAKGPTAQPKTSTPGSGTTPTQPASSSTGGDAAATGNGVIKGVVKFTTEALEMEVPKKRKDAEFCKGTEVKHNAIRVKDAKLADVWVGIWNEQVKGDFPAGGAKTIDQKDCNYAPRIVGVMPGQEIEVKNSDPTMHNVNVKAMEAAGAKTLFNIAHPKDAPPEKKTFEDPGIYRFQCDVHSWMRAFVIVTDNPFSAVSGEDGSFSIEKVPAGKYKIVAWHSVYGKKDKELEVKDGENKLDFEYDGDEEEPSENKGELDDLF